MDELYRAKIGIMRDILALTEGVDFRGNEGDADIYIGLIEKRQALFDKAKAIDVELAQNADALAAKAYKAEIADLARRIIEQDNYMKESISRIQAGLKTSVKSVKTGQNLSNIYTGTSHLEGFAHDWSQ